MNPTLDSVSPTPNPKQLKIHDLSAFESSPEGLGFRLESPRFSGKRLGV